MNNSRVDQFLFLFYSYVDIASKLNEWSSTAADASKRRYLSNMREIFFVSSLRRTDNQTGQNAKKFLLKVGTYIAFLFCTYVL